MAITMTLRGISQFLQGEPVFNWHLEVMELDWDAENYWVVYVNHHDQKDRVYFATARDQGRIRRFKTSDAAFRAVRGLCRELGVNPTVRVSLSLDR